MVQDPMNLRTSEEDRRQVEDALSAAFREGRITAQELSERLDSLHGSQTYRELAELLSDIPHGLTFVPSHGRVVLHGTAEVARTEGAPRPALLTRVAEVGLFVLFGLVALSLLPAFLMMARMFSMGIFLIVVVGLFSARAGRRHRHGRR